MVSMPAQAVGMAQSQGLFWGHDVGLWHVCCQEAPWPAQAPAAAMRGMSTRTGGRLPGPAEAHP